MLSDESIDLKQHVLGKQFADFAEFRDIVALTEQNEFDVINTAKSFIETLCTGSAHWKCAADLKHNRPHIYCCKVYEKL